MDGSQIAVLVAIIVVILLAVRAARGVARGERAFGHGGRRRRPDRDVETAAVVGLVGGSVLAGDDRDYTPGHGWDPKGLADPGGGGWGGFDGGDGGGGDGGGGGGD